MAEPKSPADTPRLTAEPAEPGSGSPRRARWSAFEKWTGDETQASSGVPAGPGDGDGELGGDSGGDGIGDGGTPRRGVSRTFLVSTGAVAAVGLLAGITASLLWTGTRPAAAGADTQTSLFRPLQPLDASPLSTGNAAVTITASAAPPTVDVVLGNASDGLVLDVDNSRTSAGTLVGMWTSDGTSAQRWHLVLQPDGAYVVYTELTDLHEGLEINTNPGAYGGDTITTLRSDTGDAQMQWTLKYLGSNQYELVSRYNGQCLRAGGGQGVAAATSACNASDVRQAWTVTG